MNNFRIGVQDIRDIFLSLKNREQYVTDKTGCRMLEIVHASFVADEPAIFGKVNQNYVNREHAWYMSHSLNVNDLPDAHGRSRMGWPEDYSGPPEAWKRAASPEGMINSNYGFLVYDEANFDQYRHCYAELMENSESRRAVMIYNRPSMWHEYDKDGMSDFICTLAHQYFVRDGLLVASVTMRSNDVIFGYKNDKNWADTVHQQLAHDLQVPVGLMYWHAGSLHVYEKHFDLIKE